MHARAQVIRRRNQQTHDPLPGWQIQNGKLHREFELKDFVTGSQHDRVALIAESMNIIPNGSTSGQSGD